MRILIFHNGGLGDTIMATPVMQMLYNNEYKLDLILHSRINREILKGLDIFENIYVIEKKIELLPFILKNFRKYDYLVGTISANPQKVKKLGLLLGVKKVFAKFNEKYRHRIYDNIENVKPLLKDLSFFEPYICLKENKSIIDKYISKTKKNLGFAIGSGKNQKFKRWNIENYIKVFEYYKNENILVFIGPDEEDLFDKIKNISYIKIVKENILDIIGVINNLDLLVGNDNGLMHIGYALNKKTLTIFGMTDKRIIGGYNDKLNFYLDLELKCRNSECFSLKKPGLRCIKNSLECLEKITIENVILKINDILKG